MQTIHTEQADRLQRLHIYHPLVHLLKDGSVKSALWYR